MNFQLFSDLHLEFSTSYPKLPVTSPNLILAGDMGYLRSNFKDFIAYCSSNWEHVFFIYGNHTFYPKKSVETLKLEYQKFLSSFPNVHLLDDSSYILDGIAIYGFINWTRPLFNSRKTALEYLGDYNYITTKNGPLTPGDVEGYVNTSLVKFKEFLRECPTEKIIVVTHFPPIRSGTSDPKYINDHLAAYFSWRNLLIDEKIMDPRIKIWCSGHTHYSYDFVNNGIHYISNQIGYKDELNNFVIEPFFLD